MQHISPDVWVAGRVGTLVGQEALVSSFNAGFGLIDLFQAVAGYADLPPKQYFWIRVDDILHIVIGLALPANSVFRRVSPVKADVRFQMLGVRNLTTSFWYLTLIIRPPTIVNVTALCSSIATRSAFRPTSIDPICWSSPTSRAGYLTPSWQPLLLETPRPRIIRAASNIVITEPAILPFALLVRPFLTEIVAPDLVGAIAGSSGGASLIKVTPAAPFA